MGRTKLINHVDHVQWVCYPENIARNVELLSIIFDTELEGPVFEEEKGFILYVGWESGLEVIAPMARVTDFNRSFHDYLAQHGEGLQTIVFGVRNIEKHRERMLALGYEASDIFGENPQAPWAGKMQLKEFIVDRQVMATQLVFGEIAYREGVIEIDTTGGEPGLPDRQPSPSPQDTANQE